MLNIISKSVYQFHPSGPKKVVDNLIKGLKELGISYTINLDPLSSPFNIIHDDIEALSYIENNWSEGTEKDINNSTKFILGPNICFEPNDLVNHSISLDSKVLQSSKWLVPSNWVKDFWKTKRYTGELSIWAVGVDTNEFKPTLSTTKDRVLLYTKGRSEGDINSIKAHLNKKMIEFIELAYGSYSENELIETANKAKYGIIITGSESQGLAIEELLALNLPLVVFNIESLNQKEAGMKTEFPATSIPYFDSNCGYSSTDLEEVKNYISKIEADLNNFKPREYILNNLSLKKQAAELCSLIGYKDAKDIKVTNKKWRNRTWLRPFLFLKYSVKFLKWKLN